MELAERIFKAEQEEGKRLSASKLPAWNNIDGIIYPARISMEQCSSLATAAYKASLVSGESLIDLTGGFGVDCATISQGFERSTYIERQARLCEIAKHNFELMGLDIAVVNSDCKEYIEDMPKFSTIFIDPARRDSKGGKVVSISDCEPDICAIKQKLIEKCDNLLVKLSPMLDITKALEALPETSEIHVVSVGNECKELLFLIDGRDGNPTIRCVNLPSDETFVFTLEMEQTATITVSMPSIYLYEPNSAIMKAGAFKSVATQFNLAKLHPNSHLYTSDRYVDNFPGRKFRIEGITGAHRNDMKGIEKANIAVRNFPASVDELRRKLKIKDGGDTYLFATTLCDGSHRIIRCSKI